MLFVCIWHGALVGRTFTGCVGFYSGMSLISIHSLCFVMESCVLCCALGIVSVEFIAQLPRAYPSHPLTCPMNSNSDWAHSLPSLSLCLCVVLPLCVCVCVCVLAADVAAAPDSGGNMNMLGALNDPTLWSSHLSMAVALLWERLHFVNAQALSGDRNKPNDYNVPTRALPTEYSTPLSHKLA